MNTMPSTMIGKGLHLSLRCGLSAYHLIVKDFLQFMRICDKQSDKFILNSFFIHSFIHSSPKCRN